MEEVKYIIFYIDSENKKEFVYEINVGSVYTTENYRNAIYFNDLEDAKNISKYLKNRQSSRNYQVASIEIVFTVMED